MISSPEFPCHYCPPIGCPPDCGGDYFFEDDFESVSFIKWIGTSTSSGETASISSAIYHHGSHSGSYTSNGNGGYENSYSYKSLSSMSDLHVRGYFYVSQSGIARAMRRLKPNRTARDWIQAIWNYAQEKELVKSDLTLDEASEEELRKVWREIFSTTQVKTIVFTEFVEPQRLLQWWMTSKRNGSQDKR